MQDFNIKFYLKDGPGLTELPIHAGIHYNSDKCRPATGLFVHPDNWCATEAAQYVTQKDAEYKKKNEELNRHKAFLQQLLKDSEDGPEFKEHLKQQYNYFKKPHLAHKPVTIKSEKNLLEYLKEWVCGRAGIKWKNQEHVTFIEQINRCISGKISDEEKKEMQVAANTLKNDRSTYQTLYNFEAYQLHQLLPSSITHEFEAQFRKYIVTHLGQDIDTYSKHISVLKNFLKWLDFVKKSKELPKDYVIFKRPADVAADVLPLSAKDLLKLHNTCMRDEFLEKARLIFLTLCSTGQHITDYNEHLEKALNSKMEDDGHEFLLLQRQKNQLPYIIPFFDSEYFRPVYYTNELIKRYGKFPKMGEKDINRALPYLLRELSIERPEVTSKYGRKTFASIHVYKLKTPRDIVRKATGHKSDRSLDDYLGIPYADIVAEFKDTAKPI